MEQFDFQQFDCITQPHPPAITVAPNQLFGTTSIPSEGSSSSNQYHNDFIETRQQLTHVIFDLQDKVSKLEELLSRPGTSNPALEGVLGMVWQELVHLDSQKTIPNTPLYNLVSCVAPNVIASSQVGKARSRHDSVVAFDRHCAIGFVGGSKGKQRE